jgi:hypothetical protein
MFEGVVVSYAVVQGARKGRLGFHSLMQEHVHRMEPQVCGMKSRHRGSVRGGARGDWRGWLVRKYGEARRGGPGSHGNHRDVEGTWC